MSIISYFQTFQLIYYFFTKNSAYLIAKRNGGPPEIDGVTFGEIEDKGREYTKLFTQPMKTVISHNHTMQVVF